MIRTIIIIALVGISTSLLAQQQPPPDVQALQARVMQEINANLQCSAAAIGLQQEVAKLKAEIEALKKGADK